MPRSERAITRGSPNSTTPCRARRTRAPIRTAWNMDILAIESSCDETAAAVVRGGRIVRGSIIASQNDLHAQYGGVVPELASRRHVTEIVPVVRAALNAAGCAYEDLDALAVTMGPGLAGSLLVGVNFAKSLAFARALPLIGV